MSFWSFFHHFKAWIAPCPEYSPSIPPSIFLSVSIPFLLEFSNSPLCSQGQCVFIKHLLCRGLRQWVGRVAQIRFDLYFGAKEKNHFHPCTLVHRIHDECAKPGVPDAEKGCNMYSAGWAHTIYYMNIFQDCLWLIRDNRPHINTSTFSIASFYSSKTTSMVRPYPRESIAPQYTHNRHLDVKLDSSNFSKLHRYVYYSKAGGIIPLFFTKHIFKGVSNSNQL